ncbi:hypothetical protein CKAH01_01728 [Colletotrichum kahawae]|uniref:Uncharacterized protein n=1 Tax=Colletotrichum kahawae TaxID=34407 RepID=A0AAD9Y2L0_COLKA|nr:hypothetical protein CKAH01_01728 [Colletotrichum kahawae]
MIADAGGCSAEFTCRMRNGASSREQRLQTTADIPPQAHHITECSPKLQIHALAKNASLQRHYGELLSYLRCLGAESVTGNVVTSTVSGLRGLGDRRNASLSVLATYHPPWATTQFQMEQQKGVQLVNGCRFVHYSGEGNFRCRLRASSRPMEGALGYQPSNISPSPMETAASSHATPRPASSLPVLGLQHATQRPALPWHGTLPCCPVLLSVRLPCWVQRTEPGRGSLPLPAGLPWSSMPLPFLSVVLRITETQSLRNRESRQWTTIDNGPNCVVLGVKLQRPQRRRRMRGSHFAPCQGALTSRRTPTMTPSTSNPDRAISHEISPSLRRHSVPLSQKDTSFTKLSTGPQVLQASPPALSDATDGLSMAPERYDRRMPLTQLGDVGSASVQIIEAKKSLAPYADSAGKWLSSRLAL